LSLDAAIGFGLVLAIFIIYAQTGRFDFVSYDDDLYVYKNPHVIAGLTLDSIRWALTAVVSSNWMPITLLSHMLDVQLFGLQAGMHHLINVVFHAASAVLLYFTLHRATRARAASAFVAFLFAVHPLHVESVAWIAERKDVLSTLFWFLALYAYVRYSENPNPRRYLPVMVFFALGLLSKPMLVTFPFTLILFDLWPLRRVGWPRLLLLDKVPLFALAAASSVVTYFSQTSAGAVSGGMPAAVRIANALNSYLTYIAQMFWPARLAVLYSFPNYTALGPPIAAFVILVVLSGLAIYVVRDRPWYAVGWFWYLGTLVPVIGLVQVGIQSHADRYTYIPMIGLAIILAWGARDLMGKWPWTRTVFTVVAPALCLAWMAVASAQAAWWRDTPTLFQHALDVTEDNWGVLFNLAHYEMKTLDRCPDAINHLNAALRIKPGYMYAEDDLGVCLMKTGRPAEAIPHFEAILRAKPDSAAAESNLGEALSRTPGRDVEAIPHFEAALRMKPDSPDTLNDLGACLLNNGRAAEAVHYFERAVRLKPDSPDAHFNLALALAQTPGRQSDAISQYEGAIRLKPDSALPHHSLALLLAKLGRKNEAISQLEIAQHLQPNPEIIRTIERLKSGQ
jgi:tetratricopeptide (TPR) repeat protein